MRTAEASTWILVGAALFSATVSPAEPGPTTGPKVLRRDAFFGIHFDLHPNKNDQELGADLDPANIRQLLQRANLDYVHYDCKGHPGIVGYPDPKVGWAAPGIVKDAIAEWRKATAEAGVSLLIHYSGLLDEAAVEHHPSWARHGPNNEVDPTLVSTFSPYVEELMLPQLQEVVSRYNLDGVWSDGDCWAAQMDYSTTSVATFMRETGITTAPLKRGEPGWDEWKAFNRKQVERYIRSWVDPLHAWRPGIQLTSNWMYASFAPKPVETDLDFLSGDLAGSGSTDNARFESRVLASTGKPWDLMSWGFSVGAGSTHLLKPAQQLYQEAASVLALGGGYEIFYQPTRRGYLVPEVIETIGQASDWCRARQDFSHHSASIPQVALLLSSESLWDRMDAIYSSHGQYPALQGALHALLELHYSVDILTEHQLEPVLQDYPVLVLAQAPRQKQEFRDRLLEYVTAGGTLLLLDRESAEPWKDLLGVAYQGEPQTVNAELDIPGGIIPVHGTWQEVETSGARVLAHRYPTRDTRKDGKVAATAISHGKGQIAAVYGPISQAFYDTHHPYLRQWIGGLTEQVFPELDLEVTAPPPVDVALRKTKSGHTAVHLMNFAEAPRVPRSMAVDHVPEVGPIQVSLRTGGRPADVTWEPGAHPLDWKYEAEKVTVTVPNLHIHGAVVIRQP